MWRTLLFTTFTEPTGYILLSNGLIQFSSVQSCPTLCNPMDCSMPGFTVITNSQSLLKLMSIESVMPSNCLILCPPLLLPSIFPSIRVFSDESVHQLQGSLFWSQGLLPTLDLPRKPGRVSRVLAAPDTGVWLCFVAPGCHLSPRLLGL